MRAVIHQVAMIRYSVPVAGTVWLLYAVSVTVFNEHTPCKALLIPDLHKAGKHCLTADGRKRSPDTFQC